MQFAHASPVQKLGRVLVVDDAIELGRATARILTKQGYQVVQAADGGQALEFLDAGQFDVVVSDVAMPDMDGVQLLQAIHQRDPSLSVFLISGAVTLETALKAVEYGAMEYLTKPMDGERLGACVARGVAACAAKREAAAALEQFRSGERLRSSVPKPSPESWSGALLAGRYRIGALIGEGGMGSVYEAVREDLGSMKVAVKIIQDALAPDPTLVARFRREAETVASIHHPNLVGILDFQSPEGEPAILVMERLHGESLGQRISRLGPLAERDVAFIGSQVASALSAAHALHVVHRDMKPDNVFLTNVSGVHDVVRLLDFGVAKLLESDTDPRLTQTGAVLGTPAYMAPEQARGREVDRRSDIYSVGCIMYEALSGRPPFFADNYNALLVAIQEDDAVGLLELRPELDAKLVGVVSRAMEKQPADRFQTADELSSALLPWTTRDTATVADPLDQLRNITNHGPRRR